VTQEKKSSIKDILIIDDHPLFRQALTLTLKSNFDNIDITEAQSIPELDNALLSHENIDLVLLDLDIPGAQGFNTLIKIRHAYPEIGVVIVSGFEDKKTISQAMTHGAAGFIPKSIAVPDMVIAINEVYAGNLWTPYGDLSQEDLNANTTDNKVASLTPKQYKILLMFADGLLNKQIAYELGLSESTIKSHASTIFLKLGVRNRTQAVIVLNELQIVQGTFGQ